MTFYLSTQEGNPSSENYAGGSTTKLFTSGSTIPDTIFYDETYKFLVAEGKYYASDTDTFETIYELTVNSSGVLTDASEVDSGDGDSVMLPSCSYLSEELATNPQALVKDVKSELIKLLNNPMALGTITNRIIYLVMNGQAAPRAYNTRFVKPIETVQRIYKQARDGSDGGDAGRFAYTYVNDSEMSGVLYYAGGTTIGLGTKVFKDDKLEAAAGDGNYRNDTNRLTVSGGEVVEYS